MTFYELSATNTRGETFTITTSSGGLNAMVDRLAQAIRDSGSDSEVRAYDAIQVTGSTLLRFLEDLHANGGGITLSWHHDSRRWQAPLADLLSQVVDTETWSVVYGDY